MAGAELLTDCVLDRGRGQAARGPPAWTAATHVIMCACMFVLCTCSCVRACACDHVCSCVFMSCVHAHMYIHACVHIGAQVLRYTVWEGYFY